MVKEISAFENVYFSEVMKAYLYNKDDELDVIQLVQNTDLTISNTVTTTKVNGHNNSQIGSIYSDKGATLTATTNVVGAGLFSLQTGEPAEQLDSYSGILVPHEMITLENAGDPIVTAHVAREFEGQTFLYFAMGGKTFTMADVADDENFSYDATTKTITPPTDPEVADATTIIVDYYHKVNDVTKITNSTTQQVSTYKIFIDGYATVVCADGTSSNARVQIIGDVQTTGSFDISTAAASENPVSIELVFANSCGTNAIYNMFLYFEENIDDVIV